DRRQRGGRASGAPLRVEPADGVPAVSGEHRGHDGPRRGVELLRREVVRVALHAEDGAGVIARVPEERQVVADRGEHERPGIYADPLPYANGDGSEEALDAL